MKSKTLIIVWSVITAIFLLLCLLIGRADGQVPSYLHDETLDTINGSVLYLTNFFAAIGQPESGLSNWITEDTNRATSQAQENVASMYGADTNGPFVLYSTNSDGEEQYGEISFITNVAMQQGGWLSNEWITNIGLTTGDTNGLNLANDGSGLNLTNGAIPIGEFNFGGNVGYQTMPAMNLTLSSTLSQFSSTFLFVRALVLGCWSFFLFWNCVAEIKEEVGLAINQRQMGGSQQSFMGTNIDVFVGLAFAGIVTFLVSFLLFGGSGIMSYVFHLHSSISTVNNGLGVLTTFSGWDIITAMLPVTGLFFEFLQFLIWRYLFLTPTILSIRGIILYLVK